MVALANRGPAARLQSATVIEERIHGEQTLPDVPGPIGVAIRSTYTWGREFYYNRGDNSPFWHVDLGGVNDPDSIRPLPSLHSEGWQVLEDYIAAIMYRTSDELYAQGEDYIQFNIDIAEREGMAEEARRLWELGQLWEERRGEPPTPDDSGGEGPSGAGGGGGTPPWGSAPDTPMTEVITPELSSEDELIDGEVRRRLRRRKQRPDFDLPGFPPESSGRGKKRGRGPGPRALKENFKLLEEAMRIAGDVALATMGAMANVANGRGSGLSKRPKRATAVKTALASNIAEWDKEIQKIRREMKVVEDELKRATGAIRLRQLKRLDTYKAHIASLRDARQERVNRRDRMMLESRRRGRLESTAERIERENRQSMRKGYWERREKRNESGKRPRDQDEVPADEPNNEAPPEDDSELPNEADIMVNLEGDRTALNSIEERIRQIMEAERLLMASRRALNQAEGQINELFLLHPRPSNVVPHDFAVRITMFDRLNMLRFRASPTVNRRIPENAQDDIEGFIMVKWDEMVRRTMGFFVYPLFGVGNRLMNVRVLVQFHTRIMRPGLLDGIGPYFRVGEFSLNSPEQRENMMLVVDKALVGFLAKNDEYKQNTDGTLIDFDFVDMVVTIDDRYGCCDAPVFINQRMDKYLYRPLVSAKSSNNCVLECFLRHSKVVNRGPTWLRKRLRVRKGEMLGPREIQKLCNMFGVKCRAYKLVKYTSADSHEVRGHAGGLELDSEFLPDPDAEDVLEGDDEEDEIVYGDEMDDGGDEAVEVSEYVEVVAHNGHFALIENPQILNMRRCGICGKFFLKRNMAAHFLKCRFCQICRSAFMVGSKKPHDCSNVMPRRATDHLSTDELESEKIRKQVKWVDKDKDGYDCMKDVGFADFETFRPPGTPAEAVYATFLRVDSISMREMDKGEDAISLFVDHLEEWAASFNNHEDEPEPQDGKKKKEMKYLTLVFFNGGKFDHFFLIKEVIRRGKQVDKIIFNGGALLSFVLFGKIRMFDIYRFVNCSLRKACIDYQCNVQKSDFDHEKMITWDSVDEYEEEWAPYLEKDVDSMAELYLKFSQLFWDKFAINIKRCLTVSQASYEFWTSKLKSVLHIPFKVEDEFMRRAAYGGRSFPQKMYFKSSEYDEEEVEVVEEETDKNDDGIISDEKEVREVRYLRREITDNLVDLDVVSLYPTAMLKPFPCGEMRWMSAAECEALRLELNVLPDEPRADIMCEVDMDIPTDFITPPVPRKGAGGEGLDWSLGPVANQVYTGVELWRAVKYGCTITKIHRTVHWGQTAEVFKEYMDIVSEIKRNAPDKKSAQYFLGKLCMNSLYGKTMMRVVMDQVGLVYNEADVKRFRKKYDIDGFISLLDETDCMYSDGPAILTGKKKDPDMACNKPTYLGAFVLSWSRYIMDRVLDKMNCWKDINSAFFYTDTDSMVVHSSMVHHVKDLIGKEFGDLDFDVAGKIIEFICLGPKEYIFVYQTKEGRVMLHKRCKGLQVEQKRRVTPALFKELLETGETKLMEDGAEGKFQGFRRVSWKVSKKDREAGIEAFSMVRKSMKRIMNKTPFTKRTIIRDEEGTHRPDYASLPLGYVGEVDGYVRPSTNVTFNVF
jgi:hypothetical protein